MIFQFDFTNNFLRPLAQSAGVLILILGAIWLIYAFYEGKRRGSYKEKSKIGILKSQDS